MPMRLTAALGAALDRVGIQPATGCPTCAMSRRGFLAAGGAAAVLANGGAATGQARPSGPGPVIDFHAHMGDRQLEDRIGGFSPHAVADGTVRRLLEPRAHIEDMDRYGIDQQVISMANAIQGISWGDARTDLEIHRRINDEIATEWVGRFPKRFHGSFTLPLQDMDLSLREIDRCVGEHRSRVVNLSSVTPSGVYLGDPSLWPFWEQVHKRDLVAFIHPHGNAKSPPLDRYAMFNSIGQGIEEAKVMGSIIYEGLFERFPGVRIVVAHGGGFLPHYSGRMDRNVTAFDGSAKNLKRRPSSYIGDFHYDSCVYSPATLNALIKIVGVDRIVLGGDYPVGDADILAELREAQLSPGNLQKICTTTPSALLGANNH